jgi:pantoate--beta-alanine ligase
MIVVETVAEVRAHLDAERARGKLIGMVGTSGALHGGHLSLVERAKSENGYVVMFWSGTLQLDWANDSALVYDRSFERDSALAESAGVDLFYVPQRDDLYARRPTTFLTLDDLTQFATEAGSPELFGFLATMVLTYLNVASPCTTYFGEKDWHQLVIFQRAAEDLLMRSAVIGCPTVREPDGLALSSRNVKLSPAERKIAPILYRALQEAGRRIEAGERDPAAIIELVTKLVAPNAPVDYVVTLEADTLQPLKVLRGNVRVLLSAGFERTHLIDNIGATSPE